MIKSKTVLVLGAGASCFYGLPLGAKLRTDILELTHPRTSAFTVAIESRVADHPLFNEFVHAFLNSRFASIDAFLGLNTRYAEVGKLAIAALLIHYEAVSENNLLRSHQQDWYDYLWNKLASEHSWAELSFEKLSIVTFNYDRSLETFLLSAAVASYGVDSKEAIRKLSQLKVIHTYGDIGSPWPNDPRYLKYGCGVTPELTKRAAIGLKVIPEARDDEPTFEEAKILLLEASTIAFLGFGFDRLNTRRLGGAATCSSHFFSPKTGNMSRSIVASCMGRTPTEAAADAKSCGISFEPRGGSGYAPNFIEGTCLDTLRQTLILG